MSNPNESAPLESELDRLLKEVPPEEPAHGDEEGAPRKRRRSKNHEHAVEGLNLTAMMDMMTIILVFLLKNYASNDENLTLSDELKPPESTAKVPMDTATTITVTSKGILVGQKQVCGVKPDGTVEGDPPHPGSSPIDALNTVLQSQVADLQAMEARGGPKFEGKLLVVADRHVPYQLLMRVLYTAGIAKFSEYKLVVKAEPGKGSGNNGGGL